MNLLSKLAILVVDWGGPEYSTSYRRSFPHSFAPARIGGGLGGGWALACEGSNPSPSARISPESGPCLYHCLTPIRRRPATSCALVAHPIPVSPALGVRGYYKALPGPSQAILASLWLLLI